ncbi:MAG TPA: hypothetical protein VGF49_05915 [Candidatus Solibacter sp.]
MKHRELIARDEAAFLVLREATPSGACLRDDLRIAPSKPGY